MTGELYFVVHNTEDGTQVDIIRSKQELLESITPDPNEDGLTSYGRNITFADDTPENRWWEYSPGHHLMIIVGRIVQLQPKTVEVVKEYELA